jgi:2,3-bisphosphoglycerate-dependent phosphoglycerate mutase
MPKLFLLRHLKSQWNLENRFSGWVDVPLSKEGILMAKKIASKISKFDTDIIYTSPLIRNESTILKIFEYIDKKYPIFVHFSGKMKKWGNFGKSKKENYIPVYVSEALNERYYGLLQGLNKKKMMQKYGFEQVHLWRRSYAVRPPGGAESLSDVIKRTTPFYKKYIEKDLRKGKNVLVVASHNSLRALIKYIEKIADKDIINVEVPFAGMIEYEFDKSLKLKRKKNY